MATTVSTTKTTTGLDASKVPSEWLKNLMTQYEQNQGYTPKTAEQIQTQAAGEYQSYYDQLRLAQRQAYDTSDLALQQQRAGLQTTYDKSREASQKQYAQNYSQADRQLLSRGMQRSSYGAQTLANISKQGADAQQQLWDAQAQAEGNIDAQRSQLAQQLAQQLTQYDASQAADVLNRIRQLEDTEYERGVTERNTQNSLASQIYEYLWNEQQAQIQQEQWQAEFDAAQKKSGGGGGGGGSNGLVIKNGKYYNNGKEITQAEWLAEYKKQNGKDFVPTGTIPSSVTSYDDFLNALNGTDEKDTITKYYNHGTQGVVGSARTGYSSGNAKVVAAKPKALSTFSEDEEEPLAERKK